jgi:hypothetical protein
VTPIDPNEAVGTQAKVVARTSDGRPHGWGRVISYSIVPTFEIERPDGTRFSWRHDMVEAAPCWALLFGIDPGYGEDECVCGAPIGGEECNLRAHLRGPEVAR